ncbi:MAG: ferritin, partial [Lentisphaerae bacterium]
MKLSGATIDILQKQLLNELIAFYTYMDLACWCDAHSYPGAAHWMKVQCQ